MTLYAVAGRFELHIEADDAEDARMQATRLADMLEIDPGVSLFTDLEPNEWEIVNLEGDDD